MQWTQQKQRIGEAMNCLYNDYDSDVWNIKLS